MARQRAFSGDGTEQELYGRPGLPAGPAAGRLDTAICRHIGALLRQARLEASLSVEELAEQTGIDSERLQSYEWGQTAAPLPELETLCGVLQRSVREFQDQHGPVGEWNARQRALQDFLTLPLELQVFVSKPVNRPYLDLAVRLSDMTVEKLRAVAEGLLEITY